MRKLFFIFLMVMGALAVQAQTYREKVVVQNDGSVVGRYVRETKTAYIANPLDWEITAPKKDHRVEIWTPEKGKGFVCRKDNVRGNINVRKGPSTKTAVVAQITEEDSKKDYPENTFKCLGKTKQWFKISIKGKVGYVRQDLVDWDAYLAD